MPSGRAFHLLRGVARGPNGRPSAFRCSDHPDSSAFALDGRWRASVSGRRRLLSLPSALPSQQPTSVGTDQGLGLPAFPLVSYCAPMGDDIKRPSLEEQREDLLKRALDQPGVAALMEVYRSATESAPHVPQSITLVTYSAGTGTN